MSHQAIARKWRPRLFEEIVGQTHVTRTLQNAIRLGRIHHAFLLTGARGVGKTSAARILARALNCEQGPSENPCNECGSCTEMLAGTFPDLLEIDAASHNSVDDIRDLVEKVRYAPQRGRYKVYVIDEVHMVSKAGFNALLKTLEEPPPHVIFILATTDPQQLLDTVISRCQRFDFKMIPVRTVYERLHFVAEQEGVAVPDSSLLVIAREGGGSMRDAQSLLDQVMSFAGESVTEEEVAEILGFIDRTILYEVLEGALEGNPATAIEALSKVSVFGYDVRTFAAQLLEAVRNVHVVLQVREAERLLDLPDDEITRLKKLASGQDAKVLQRHFEVLATAVDALHRSEQPLLLLEMAVARMAAIRPFVAVETLVDRLESLERRIRKAGLATSSSGGPARPPQGRGSQTEAPRPTSWDNSSDAPAIPPAPPLEDVVVAEAPPAEESSAPRTPPAPPAATAPPAGPNGGGSIADMLIGLSTSTATTTAPSPPQQPTPTGEAPTAPAEASTASEDTTPDEPSSPGEAAETEETTQPVEATRTAEATEATEDTQDPNQGSSSPEVPALLAETEALSEAEVSEPAPEPAPAQPSPEAAESPAVALSAERPDPPGTDLCDATRWRRFVHRLAQQEDMGVVAAPLAVSGFLGTRDKSISIGFLSAMPMRQLGDVASSPSLQRQLHEVFGEGTTLTWSLDEDGRSGRSLAEELTLQRSERRAELEKRAQSNEAVERAQQIFPGAGIADVFLPENLEITDVR